jgi:hypothetical protein
VKLTFHLHQATRLRIRGAILHSPYAFTVWCLVKDRDKFTFAYNWLFLGFNSRRGLGIFLFTTESRTALGPTQPPIQWVPGALFPGVNRPEREADHSPPSSAELSIRGAILHSPYAFMVWCLVKDRDKFTFTYNWLYCL